MPSPRNAILALCLLAGACSPHGKPGSPGSSANSSVTSPAVGADAGLEITTFVSAAPARTLAAALAPYADQSVPISHELQDIWDAHGLRMISMPIDDAPAVLAKLQTGGGSQRQWLGQAYSWTEAARGQPLNAGSVVALDAERIRLSAGSLRLLVRSWLEPAPPEPQVGVVSGGAAALPGVVLRVELVPQHQEAHPDESRANPLAINEPKIEAESQGMVFSRLYARMTVPAGRALLIVSERPSVDWKRLASQPDPAAAATVSAPPAKKVASTSDSESVWPKHPGQVVAAPPPESPQSGPSSKDSKPPAGSAPRLGQVVRGPISPSDAAAPASGESSDASQDTGPGPAGFRVATLGEAMLSRPGSGSDSRTPSPPLRTIVLLLPRVPKEFRLLGPTAAVTPSGPPRRAAPQSND